MYFKLSDFRSNFKNAIKFIWMCSFDVVQNPLHTGETKQSEVQDLIKTRE